MRINDEFAKKIDEEYANKKERWNLTLKIGLSGEGISKVSGSQGWEVCKIEELSDMIESLTLMKKAIEEVSGIQC